MYSAWHRTASATSKYHFPCISDGRLDADRATHVVCLQQTDCISCAGLCVECYDDELGGASGGHSRGVSLIAKTAFFNDVTIASLLHHVFGTGIVKTGVNLSRRDSRRLKGASGTWCWEYSLSARFLSFQADNFLNLNRKRRNLMQFKWKAMTDIAALYMHLIF